MVDIVGWACHYLSWTTHTIGRIWAWHEITALGQHTLSATSGVECHHRPWTTLTVKRRLARHAIIAFEQHTQLNDVGRGMPSSPLGSTSGRTMSGVACHNRLKAAHIVERRRAWHDITSLGQHTRLNDVGRGMTSPPLDSTHGRQRRA